VSASDARPRAQLFIDAGLISWFVLDAVGAAARAPKPPLDPL
jgi:hypothetical protein